MLMSQFTITGYDACAHMSEETKGADKSAAYAIIIAISASAVAGFAYILAITFSIQVRSPLSAWLVDDMPDVEWLRERLQGYDLTRSPSVLCSMRGGEIRGCLMLLCTALN